MQLRLITVLGATLVITEKETHIGKVGTKSNIAKCTVKEGVRQENCNYPEDVNVVAVSREGLFYLIFSFI